MKRLPEWLDKQLAKKSIVLVGALVDHALHLPDSLVDTPPMAPPRKPPSSSKKTVQICFDRTILRHVDAAEEAKQIGRSAYVMRAIVAYIRLKQSTKAPGPKQPLASSSETMTA